MRLLVVDDERRLARALEHGLTAEGYLVDVAHDGGTGLDAALTGGYDAIVLDLMLPVLSGYEVVRRLRAADVWTPVLMLTAKDGEYDEADALDEGADDYLTKPFSLVVLVARIRALLRRGLVARPTVLRSGSVEVDPGSRRVLRDGQEVEITAREFALLSYLTRHAGQVVSKAELYEHVWESHDADRGLNVVEVYVGYLRRKLGRDVVETVRGAGYRAPEHHAS
ncbi:MAG TPA: response regulator transcription factor [Mycobacteriales bacterium]|jgi:DNA-binding response OmpR family regulator|nr:response regulator transcription factor [Mycobacteriales bacterium]